MARGRQRSARANLVAQAALVWGADSLDLETFVETGSFSAATEKVETNPVVREAMIAGLEGRGADFVNALIRKDMAEREAAKGLVVDGNSQ